MRGECGANAGTNGSKDGEYNRATAFHLSGLDRFTVTNQSRYP